MACFTFKKEPCETGLAGVGNPNPSTIIKLKKRQVGSINGPNWNSDDDKWHVRLIIKDEKEEYCGWKWVKLKVTFDDEPSARVYLNEHHERIMALNLHQLDDE